MQQALGFQGSEMDLQAFTEKMISDRKKEQATSLCEKMKALGYDPRENTRKRDIVSARAMVAYALYQECFTKPEIGELLGVSRHSVSHYLELMEDIFTLRGYEAERDLWKKFEQEWKHS